MTHSFQRLARFLAVSRLHLLDGAMPSRRVPRRSPSAADDHDDGYLASVPDMGRGARPAVWPGLASWPRRDAPSAPGARTHRTDARADTRADAARTHSNENRPSATSFASG